MKSMYVLTNNSKNRGAAVILYEGVLSNVADRMRVDVLMKEIMVSRL